MQPGAAVDPVRAGLHSSGKSLPAQVGPRDRPRKNPRESGKHRGRPKEYVKQEPIENDESTEDHTIGPIPFDHRGGPPSGHDMSKDFAAAVPPGDPEEWNYRARQPSSSSSKGSGPQASVLPERKITTRSLVSSYGGTVTVEVTKHLCEIFAPEILDKEENRYLLQEWSEDDRRTLSKHHDGQWCQHQNRFGRSSESISVRT